MSKNRFCWTYTSALVRKKIPIFWNVVSIPYEIKRSEVICERKPVKFKKIKNKIHSFVLLFHSFLNKKRMELLYTNIYELVANLLIISVYASSSSSFTMRTLPSDHFAKYFMAPKLKPGYQNTNGDLTLFSTRNESPINIHSFLLFTTQEK